MNMDQHSRESSGRAEINLPKIEEFKQLARSIINQHEGKPLTKETLNDLRLDLKRVVEDYMASKYDCMGKANE